jgi:hypothetical protein
MKPFFPLRREPIIMVAILAGLLAVQNAFALPAQIILLRHAEKPADESDTHLAPQGRVRAAALVSFLTTAPQLVTNGPPVALFAVQPTVEGRSLRPRETLEPLAKYLKLPIQVPYPAKDYAALARKILHDPAYDGKQVIICWVHASLAELAEELGVRPKPADWGRNVFDRLWLISYHGDQASLEDLPQKLGAAGLHGGGARLPSPPKLHFATGFPSRSQVGE